MQEVTIISVLSIRLAAHNSEKCPFQDLSKEYNIFREAMVTYQREPEWLPMLEKLEEDARPGPNNLPWEIDIDLWCFM